jgi:creatinine amidohydrolase
VKGIDADASHASWMENFRWTRVAGVAQPAEAKPMVDVSRLRTVSPAEVRTMIGDGNFGGRYERPDSDMDAVWSVAVEETRALITTW